MEQKKSSPKKIGQLAAARKQNMLEKKEDLKTQEVRFFMNLQKEQ